MTITGSNVVNPSRNAIGLIALTIGLLVCKGIVAADERVDEILEVQQVAVAADRETQLEIDELADQTQEAVSEYRLRLQELDRLRRFNDNLQRTIDDQNREKNSLTQQIDDFSILERGIVPLLLDMVDDLERFVTLDLPFRTNERLANVKRLRELFDRADVSIAEKYRQVMASYQDEVAIGRNIESYSGQLDVDGTTRTVDFLRVGRVLLAYQTPDRERNGYWDAQAGQWRELESKYRRSVSLGLRIAQRLAPPDMLTLPISTPPPPQAGE